MIPLPPGGRGPLPCGRGNLSDHHRLVPRRKLFLLLDAHIRYLVYSERIRWIVLFITTLAKRINNCCGLLSVGNTHHIFKFATFLEEMNRFTLTKLASKI
jgi:hypothetical protein